LHCRGVHQPDGLGFRAVGHGAGARGRSAPDGSLQGRRFQRQPDPHGEGAGDRAGAQRVQHIGYKGTQQLFDRITNALIEYKQEHSPIGYKYI